MTHGKHEKAFGFAGADVQQTENALAVALERADQAVETTKRAVGPRPKGAGARALAKVETVQTTVRALIGTCEEAKTELNAYGLGW